MLLFVLKRLLSGLVTLFLFQTAIFFTLQVVIPGDFASQYAMVLTQDEMQELRQQLGLDLPLGQRYIHWIVNLLRGELGRSFSLRGSGDTVVEVMKRATPPTILVFGVGTLLAFMLGLWLGKLTAWTGPGLIRGAATFSGIALYTSFPPWLAFLLVYFLSTQLGLLPRLFSNQLWRQAPFTTSQVMLQMVLTLFIALALVLALHLFLRRLIRRPIPIPVFLLLALAIWVLCWRLANILPYAVDVSKAASLPLIGYVLLSFGEIMLVMRISMMDVMHEQYVHTAFAKGLPGWKVRDRHVARNALLPVLSGLVIRLPYLLTGAVMLERALNWQGIGTELFMAVGLQNIMLVMGLLLVIGTISLGVRVLLDIVLAALDPRIRIEAGQLKGL